MNNRNTEDLWNAVKKMGRFSDSYYDKNIEWDMKKELGLSKNASLQKMPPEVIFSTFFKVMSPLAMMYEDILCLFEQCRADRSAENIEIEFQSSQFSSAKFNIQHFMEARQILEKIKVCSRKISVRKDAKMKIWSMHQYKIYDKKEEIINNRSFRRWAQAYWAEKDKWPESELDFEQTVQELPIAELLLQSFACWRALFDFYRRESRTYWCDECWKCGETEQEFCFMEKDYCLHSVLFSLYYFAERYLSFSETEQKEIQNQMTEFLTAFCIIEQYEEKNKQAWREFLQLPVWERRHEVYSIWVFTQMTAAFPKECIVFEVKDKTLVFPFGGAKLATVKLYQKEFAIWTELRTQAVVVPVGKGRKGAIQPDYSVVCGDEKNIGDTVAVVECKQYKRAGRKNFSAAIADYAANRPEAKVMLADYGEVNPERISAEIRKIPQSRYDIFSNCRPQGESAARLRQEICRLLYSRAASFTFNQEYAIHFVLSWNGTFAEQDLDLHMSFSNGGETRTVSYRHQEIDGVEYSGDVRKSPGKEWIAIKEWHQGVYDVWVHNYSENVKFGEGKPVVRLEMDYLAQPIEIEFAEDDTGSAGWWHVFRLDTRWNTGYIVNRMADSMTAENSGCHVS